jgi:hypothetical protein
MANKTVLTTISDDRSGRKGGIYEATQDKMWKIFTLNEFIDKQQPWNISYITHSIDDEIQAFYQQNKVMLDNKDAAINGRLYKPYVINEGLKTLDEGDYLIYNDCSPEMWTMDEDFEIDKNIYDIEVIKNLCKQAKDFLVAFVKWAPENFKEKPLGFHTHHYFTLEPCIKAMRAEKYRNSYQCASGMICIRKTAFTSSLVQKWLNWNRIPECACIGYPDKPGDQTFWDEKEDFKLGCRHDQSILSILLNKLDWSFVDILYNNISPYNFLNFCRLDANYKFINSNSK